MTNLTNTNLLAEIDASFADNTVRAITPALLRQYLHDALDSTRNYAFSSIDTSGVQTFEDDFGPLDGFTIQVMQGFGGDTFGFYPLVSGTYRITANLRSYSANSGDTLTMAVQIDGIVMGGIRDSTVVTASGEFQLGVDGIFDSANNVWIKIVIMSDNAGGTEIDRNYGSFVVERVK